MPENDAFQRLDCLEVCYSNFRVLYRVKYVVEYMIPCKQKASSKPTLNLVFDRCILLLCLCLYLLQLSGRLLRLLLIEASKRIVV